MAFLWCERAQSHYEHSSGLQISEKHREMILRGVIERVLPPWWHWPFNCFTICPLNDAAQLFRIDWSHKNSAYLLLDSYHCVPRSKIPREIRKAIPDLVREALSSKVTAFCEIEEGKPEAHSAWCPREGARVVQIQTSGLKRRGGP
jgi:hypothetical protein